MVPEEELAQGAAGCAEARQRGPTQNWRRSVRWSTKGFGRRPDDLRYSAASLRIAAWVDIKTMSSWLGYSTALSTLDTMATSREPTLTGRRWHGSTARSGAQRPSESDRTDSDGNRKWRLTSESGLCPRSSPDWWCSTVIR